MTPEQLVGPFALTFGSVAVVIALWRDHLRSDADDRAVRDRSLAIAEHLTDAVNRLTDALEQQARDHAARQRRGDETP